MSQLIRERDRTASGREPGGWACNALYLTELRSRRSGAGRIRTYDLTVPKKNSRPAQRPGVRSVLPRTSWWGWVSFGEKKSRRRNGSDCGVHGRPQWRPENLVRPRCPSAGGRSHVMPGQLLPIWLQAALAMTAGSRPKATLGGGGSTRTLRSGHIHRRRARELQSQEASVCGRSGSRTRKACARPVSNRLPSQLGLPFRVPAHHASLRALRGIRTRSHPSTKRAHVHLCFQGVNSASAEQLRRAWGSNPQGLRSPVFETGAVAICRLGSPEKVGGGTEEYPQEQPQLLSDLFSLRIACRREPNSTSPRVGPAQPCKAGLRPLRAVVLRTPCCQPSPAAIC